MFKMGIIGCGGIVEKARLNVLLEASDRIEIIALCDVVEDRLALIGEKIGIPREKRYSDYRVMLEQEDLGLVLIATPHSLHKEQTIAAAQAGAIVLLDKPLAMNLDEADEILDAVNINKVNLGVIHNLIYHPTNQKAIDLVRKGSIGRLFFIRGEFLWGDPGQGRGGSEDWRAYAKFGGGTLIDRAYHEIYVALAMMNSPVKKVIARIYTLAYNVDVDDTAFVLMEHENGGVSSVQASWCVKSKKDRKYEMHGKEGSIYVCYGKKRPLALYSNKREAWSYPEIAGEKHEDFLLGFTQYLKHFLDAVEKRQQPPISGDQAREILSIVSAAYESSRTGKVIDV